MNLQPGQHPKRARWSSQELTVEIIAIVLEMQNGHPRDRCIELAVDCIDSDLYDAIKKAIENPKAKRYEKD